MTTFSPDDPSIWLYRRKDWEELPPELVAARRESLRRRRPQQATVSETCPEHMPISAPDHPPAEAPVERYAHEYRVTCTPGPTGRPVRFSLT